MNIKNTVFHLWAEKEALHPNDPCSIDYGYVMVELLVVDKQATMAFIPMITDPDLLCYLTYEFYYIIDTFKCRKLAAIWKQQIMVFKSHFAFDRMMENYKEGITALNWSFDYRFLRIHNRALWTFLNQMEYNHPSSALYREMVGAILALCKRATADMLPEIIFDFHMKEITIHIVYVTERLKNIQLLKIWKQQIDRFQSSVYYWEMIGNYQLAQQLLPQYYRVKNDFKMQIRPKIMLSPDMFDEMLQVDGCFDSDNKILMQYQITVSPPLNDVDATAIQQRFLNHFKWLEPIRGDAWHCGLTYICCWESGKPIKTFVETASFLLDEQENHAIIWLSFRVNVFAIEYDEEMIVTGELLPAEMAQHNQQRFNNSLESIGRDDFFKLESISAGTFVGQLNEKGFITP
ncbi:MAG: hypothetical protein RL329_3540 [Bacteroidota bacterium]|jgi:hypothetical protein